MMEDKVIKGFIVLSVVGAVAALVTVLLGIWTGDDRWIQTAGASVMTAVIAAFLIFLLGSGEKEDDGRERTYAD